MVVENQSVYEELLARAIDSQSILEKKETDLKDKSKQKTRRQTPLVNAGYAVRVLSISHAIRSFVSYHKFLSSSQRQGQAQTRKGPKRRIRIVFLGCGVDVIGIWSRSLVQNNDNILLTVIEIDKLEICSIKKEMITSKGMVKNLVEHAYNSTTEEANVKRYYSGNIVVSPHESSANYNDDCCDYVLIPGDLMDTSTLEPILLLDNKYDEENVPTLVVSELVLSYISPSCTKQLLQWCSNRLCVTNDSAFVSLEPLGFSGMLSQQPPKLESNNNCETIVTVEEGYRRDYCQKFHNKMEHGRSSTKIENQTALLPCNGLFHPVASSAEEFSCTMRNCGFDRTSSTTNLGTISSIAASWVSNSKCDNNILLCPDVFDEHAALIMHLQSYGFACGLVATQTQERKDHTDFSLFRRLLCPWERRRPDLALVKSGLPIMDLRGGILYDEIEVGDEASVRRLFQDTYNKEYTDKYPAIRKMVRGALNHDLRETVLSNVNGGSQLSQVTLSSDSTIGEFYRSSGGIFLVAAKYAGQYLPHSGIGDTTDSHPIQSKVRQIVGCVGIRLGKNEGPSRNFEILRLAVAAEHRGQGIGKALLRSVEAYTIQRWKNQQHKRLRFVANTLTILEDASKLYERFGYKAETDTSLGNTLVLRSYTKDVQID